MMYKVLERMTASQLIAFLAVSLAGTIAAAEPPKSPDQRIEVVLFAEHPQIVTPTGLAVDSRGRVFVAESHTHFRPDGYDGPAADRILIFEDTDGDGRADKRTVFHEGFTYLMDIEFHRDGSLYAATRSAIHRLRDTDGDDRADQDTRLIRLETKGNYPHNGLSGIAFDIAGGFHFGLGENLGEAYTLVGADGKQLAGGGEGGSTYWVDDEGKELRRVSTGWWNPYGMCTDSFGRIFGTDNDPDASPPCRLIQVVEGGNYGYEFRYGRSGRNPLIAWNGEIPGTLPMIAGTGEAPCHIVAYESDALPQDYYGHLLLPSWADHRVEHYGLEQNAKHGLVATRRQTLVAGGDDFRPVGIDVAPDGTVYVSDWVSSSYTLHKQGRIWQIRPSQKPNVSRSTDNTSAVVSPDRRVRERAAEQLKGSPEGQKILLDSARAGSLAQARATALRILPKAIVKEAAQAIASQANEDPVLQSIAMGVLNESAVDANDSVWRDKSRPVVLRVAALNNAKALGPAELAPLFSEHDPLLQHAAVNALARSMAGSQELPSTQIPAWANLLALKQIREDHAQRVENYLRECLRGSDVLARFTAVKWIADDKLVALRPSIETLLNDANLDLETFLAIQVALQRLDGKPIQDRPPGDRLLERITAEPGKVPASIRRLALQLIDPAFPGLKLEHLARLLKDESEELRLEVVRTMNRIPHSQRLEVLARLAADEKESAEVRATATAGLAAANNEYRDLLLRLTTDRSASVRGEALRSLVGVELSNEQRAVLEKIPHPDHAEAIQRLTKASPRVLPPNTDTDAWLQIVPTTGDARTGERIFFGITVGTCSKCHQANGRGAAVGPDLSRISERVRHAESEGRRWLFETILQPSRDMAPQYTPWLIVTKDGRQWTGLPRRKGGNSEAYLGTDGREFSLKTSEIELHREADVSIMPAELLNSLTPQEVADLFAFLTETTIETAAGK